ncbi:MAG: YbaB/EbfC family nucleoid-associated protein [Sphingomonadaceae bacterium]|uniref:YbaB/EbfC family nucleoid-associated protein n=1 Tax=Thermaurantiacus sp. TaxID=2820283 RepID=UPI00298F22B5|nr:YbaB/EbfC family nucleoid-associated protein [Thermaurantiacus sp.]MCS6987139.1 YbaB/EbfC family nucleoid-associated protein [Sphingomonadaceae bacterium]MDW8415827.1 YbaB/EbfC family nucleoid-associated protein [Thermaurantiacus sp.]
MKSLEDILKLAGSVQAELEKAQAALDRLEVEGVAGGGLVRIIASAKGRIAGISIDPSLLSPEQKEILEDLLVAAFNDARARADEAAQNLMREMTQGLPLPPGFRF